MCKIESQAGLVCMPAEIAGGITGLIRSDCIIQCSRIIFECKERLPAAPTFDQVMVI